MITRYIILLPLFVFIISCSTDDNRFVYHHFDHIRSNSEIWINIMKEEVKKTTINQKNIHEDYFHYNMTTTQLYRELSLLKHHYKLETKMSSLKKLLSKKNELVRTFYSFDNTIITKDLLSQLIAIEIEINTHLVKELNIINKD